MISNRFFFLHLICQRGNWQFRQRDITRHTENNICNQSMKVFRVTIHLANHSRYINQIGIFPGGHFHISFNVFEEYHLQIMVN